ncbi:MAG: hypothetical protein FH758_12515 [Firmicutes bacterium]|nr:hypothetical protein [Bacillota bacterium]
MTGEQLIENINEIYYLVHQANTRMAILWLENMVFTWRWWLELGLTIIPWIVWFIVRKKESTDRLLYAALVTALIAGYLDYAGIALGLWSYKSQVIPFIPAFMPWDFTLLPVFTMFFLQYYPKVNPWIKALLYAGFGSFIVQPFAVYLDLYDPKQWKHYYSVPFLIVIYLIAHYFAYRSKFKKLDTK